MDNRKKSAIVIVALLLIALGVWAFRGDGVDPAVAALEAQRDVMFSPNATDADRAAFRAQIEALTDEQRRQFFERGRPQMQQQMQERMNEFFNQTPEQLRQEAARRASDIIADRAARDDDADLGPGGPPDGRGQMTEAERDSRRKQMLDRIPSQTRAQFSEFRKMINDELKARGQDEMSGRDMRAMMGGRGGRRGPV
ncbi:hypothetical protein [Botrimarina mediterranea]|uniref:Uncharacterized protein n=1 Tax=Botrimarina mediterranea TaxID=2528022 RepID=A0A518KDF6_9BACT|nr:hypothetical protein [Botrimarina mediterranea]QDV75817.1 hypothetical protein Spa11_40400 [Botrimarina mediterranea]QDV80414.1 hypothetical protein K2D_40430 [Planctomycetes bacterium K2D]